MKKNDGRTVGERMSRLMARPAQPSVWIGARRHLGARGCDICVWHDASRGEVRLAAYVPADAPREALGVLLGEAMLSPRMGRPARPRTLVVLTAPDLEAVRLCADMFGIQVHEAFDPRHAEHMLETLETLMGRPDPGYLDVPESDRRLVGRLYEQTRDLLFCAPWKKMPPRSVLVVDGVVDGPLYVTVTGRGKTPRGLLITDALDGTATPAPPLLSLRLDSARDAGPAIVDEAAREGWPVAGAYPVLTRPDDGNALADGLEVEVAGLVIEAVVHAFEQGPPCSLLLRDGTDVAVSWLAAA